MKSRVKRACAVFSGIAALAAVFMLVITCKDPAGGKNPGGGDDTENGETRLVVSMHDSQLASPGAARKAQDTRNIQSLNLTVIEMNISNPDGGWLTILDEPRDIDIIAASHSRPVVLSDVSIEPGSYKELRLKLSDGSTITVDGETFPIKVPSGESSGLKLKGPFEIPKGKLFTLIIDLDTAESVSWNRGQGWRLGPVLGISNGANVLGIFRGNMTVAGSLGASETLLELYEDDTARLRISDYPSYTLSGSYSYNSGRKTLELSNFSLSAPGLRRRALKEVMKQVPEKITLPVKQWSPNSIIAIDTGGLTCNLYRVDDFNFSEGVSFTEFVLNVDYPDASMSGKDLITEIRFIDTGMPPLIVFGELEGSRFTKTVEVLNSYIQGDSTRIRVTSYLFERPEGMNTDFGKFGGLPAWYMTGANISETTANPWQPPATFTLIRDAEDQEFTVKFPQRMNIRSGDVIRIEIFPLDNSGALDSAKKTGALYMDSLNIVR